MDHDDLPKLEPWHYDESTMHNSPEMQRQKPVSWAAVGNGMASDARQRHAIKWYFNAPYILGVLLIGTFLSSLIGLVMVAVGYIAVLTSLLSAPKSPHKTGEIIGWSIAYGLLGLLILAL